VVKYVGGNALRVTKRRGERPVDQDPNIDGRVKPQVAELWRRYYPEYRLDQFARRVGALVQPTDAVLEIGAGSGTGNQVHFELQGKVARYVGIDPDPRVLDNPYLDEAHEGFAERMPFADATFDVVFHSYVAEHFEAPEESNREIARVLRPNGHLVFQTPSRYYYPMLAATVTPHRFHEWYVRRLGSGRSEEETFPTFYRCNDRRTICKGLEPLGFTVDVQEQSIPPGYLRFSRASFLAGVAYERTVERLFPALRGRIVVVARKA